MFTMGKHDVGVSADSNLNFGSEDRLFKIEQFNLFEISPFGVLHSVDYRAFIRLPRGAPKSKDIYERLFFAIFLYHCYGNADQHKKSTIQNFHLILTPGMKLRFIELQQDCQDKRIQKRKCDPKKTEPP